MVIFLDLIFFLNFLRQVKHIRIEKGNGNFWIEGHQDRSYPSIRRLVEEYVRDEKKLVSKPLMQY